MIQRVFTLFILLQIQLIAIHYNSTVIELEAKIFPKILMLNEDIKKHSESLLIFIVSKEKDRAFAEEFQESIERIYSDKIIGKNLIVSIKNHTSLDKLTTSPHAIIVLHHTQDELLSIANWANTNSVVSFAYDPSYLEFNLLCSLYIGTSTKPYFNKEILQKYNFSFSPHLLKLSKFK